MLNLQKPSLRHEETFLDAVRKSRALHKGLVSPPASPAEFQQYIKSLRKENRVGFLVTLPESSDLVGVVNVNEIVRGLFQSAYLGYYAFLPYAGRGLMCQGMKQVIRYCFKELRLHRLEANIQPENERSIALVKALGFSKEGYSPGDAAQGTRPRDRHLRWGVEGGRWGGRAMGTLAVNEGGHVSPMETPVPLLPPLAPPQTCKFWRQLASMTGAGWRMLTRGKGGLSSAQISSSMPSPYFWAASRRPQRSESLPCRAPRFISLIEMQRSPISRSSSNRSIGTISMSTTRFTRLQGLLDSFERVAMPENQ